MSAPEPDSGLKTLAERPASFWQTARAVAWSFFGVRRGAAYQEDVQRLNPVHVVLGGIVGAALFVGLLVLLVRWVVGSGVAGG
jgi:Protein of unknown function (DUF2970)